MTEAKRTEPPHGGLMNKAWLYVPAANTDIRKTFDVARSKQRVATLQVAQIHYGKRFAK